MSFRRRNIGIPSTSTSSSAADVSATGPHSRNIANPPSPPPPGSRPSPIDGRLTTSTGTPSLDWLLAGHAGLPLGTSLLVEESGTTDYGGVLLRYFAAEGLVQGHGLFVVGAHERWARDLPGLVVGSGLGKEGQEGQERSERDDQPSKIKEEKMKIAWRYEKLGQIDASAASSRDPLLQSKKAGEVSQVPTRPFCHVFDLRKKLEHPPDAVISFLKLSHHPEMSPFTSILEQMQGALAASTPSGKVHRLVVPGLLSPQTFPPHSSLPQHVLQFLKGIRALLAAYPKRFVAMMTLPLSLFPRASGLVRWMELLSDGVVELAPFPHSPSQELAGARNHAPGESEVDDEPPQGLLKLHRLPIFHERGVGTSAAADDWSFTLSRRKFTIKPYSLPPIEGDTEAQQVGPAGQQPKKSDLEF